MHAFIFRQQTGSHNLTVQFDIFRHTDISIHNSICPISSIFFLWLRRLAFPLFLKLWIRGGYCVPDGGYCGSALPVANSMEMVQNQGYHKIACGGFSAGCDMLLRAVAFSSAGRRSGCCCLGAVISTFGTPVASCHIVS